MALFKVSKRGCCAGCVAFEELCDFSAGLGVEFVYSGSDS